MQSYRMADSDLFDHLETGDVKLCFHDGRSVNAHGTKLASLGGCLQIIMEDMMEDQIAALGSADGGLQQCAPRELRVRGHIWAHRRQWYPLSAPWTRR